MMKTMTKADREIMTIADNMARDTLLKQAREHGVRVGDKVFLASIPCVDLSDATHRRILLALNRDGMVSLCRADLVVDAHIELRKASELDNGTGCFHCVMV
jgi:hypothetical protein